MAKMAGKKKNKLTNVKEIKVDKINVFYRRSLLKLVLKILTMEHGGFRTLKSVKNINRLFTHINMDKYQGKAELQAYIWAICYFSKQWLAGIISPDIIAEMAKSREDYNDTIGDVIKSSFNDKTNITPPEVKSLFDLIAEHLQLGYVASMKDEYINLFDDIDSSEPGAMKKIVERLFLISQSLQDIKYDTNMVINKVQFNTADRDSILEGIRSTQLSLQSSGNLLKTGIKRLNTLFSPALMNGRLYIFAGLPGSYKSGILLKIALDIRKYNPNFKPKTPGMKPCVLYVTMENTFTETIERVWNMCFDDPIINYSEEEAMDKICNELGVAKIVKDDIEVKEYDANDNNNEKTLKGLLEEDNSKEEMNIEIVIQYYPYRSISTDDLYTIIQDLRDENLEVCAFVFDYIKRIEPAQPIADNERLELDRIMNELKALAVINDIPVISAHQLNRMAAKLVDEASKKGLSDVIRKAGRDNIGSSYKLAS